MDIADPAASGDGLLRAARALAAEDGPELVVAARPELAEAVARALAADVGRAIERHALDAASLDALVVALLTATTEATRRWADVLPVANLAVERQPDFDRFAATVEPVLDALERAVAGARERGLVHADIVPADVALVLRDVLDRSAKATILFGRGAYAGTAAALVRAALRA
jgi:hypothetical protein